MAEKEEDRSTFQGVVRLAMTLPQTAAEAVKGKYACWKASQLLTKERRPFGWKESAAHSIRDQLERLLSDRSRIRDSAFGKEEAAAPLLPEDRDIVQRIRISALEANRSNITRTEAYYECYLEFPELHWAFLAHMVSRNAGWNMTDLKGGLLSDVVADQFREDMYQMLERSNALIFLDAYPQLLLYMHSRKLGRSLFHLLPEFRVSAFMRPFWERFWIERDSALLAVGLIINEQNYIEGRVVQNSYFQKNILRSPAFTLHGRFQMNQVIFPMLVKKEIRTDQEDASEPPSAKSEESRENTGHEEETCLNGCRGMVGLVLEQFSNLEERIAFGKALYAMLFGYKDVLNGVQAFAAETEHRGSRQEYWPKLFTSDKKAALNSPGESSELLKSEWLPPGKRLYSPSLNEVWHDVPYEPITRYDWFKSRSAIDQVTRPKRPVWIEMTHAHRYAVQKTALTHDAERAVTK
ncbi:DUF2515 domain-containing protein [Paenibacillus sp. HJL G12]|uniref:DUF2515 domain-containing protein n=1 Tax=Paenibacillus dendrobii TaxID=2691084 RepID=A0A7X3IMY3_9BACL|nr:DUF2515 family protein [Paenibacillus dendrobii]MWV46919.1 DUF2515 domain-containing protein [Paenibacillus dendrobii]